MACISTSLILPPARQTPDTPSLTVGKGDTAYVADTYYTLTSCIAIGTTGEVWKAHDEDGLEVVAIKILRQARDSFVARKISQHLHLLKEFVPDALRFLSASNIGVGQIQGYECTIDQLYAGNLRQVIDDRTLHPLPSEHCRSIIWQVLNGLHYLHDIGIIHGNIKPENIFLLDNSTIEVEKIVQNGVSKTVRMLRSPLVKIGDLSAARLPRQKAYYPGGSAGYRCPEVEQCSDWTTKADVFALGCVSYELLAGRELLPDQKNSEMRTGNENMFPYSVDFKSNWAQIYIKDRVALSFVKKATVWHTRRRPTIASLLRHQYFIEFAKD
ncbi:hypothetical protein CVT26_000570 [Gymnopilus dilepis]|uniref:Protein kinase domain-containing protein n=1 Tax=Gymnopilus dilepis TaxID=231916 RepID=A0A409VH88_9AGAR|nr:hypothetical protein CVT26_000570 [Gymnopilus dilepis]